MRLSRVLLVIVALAATACGSRVEAQEVDVVGTTLPALFSGSDVVMVGTVESEAGTVNTARDPQDITRPHPAVENIAQLYRLRVEEALKGGPRSQITVAVPRASRTVGGTRLENWPWFIALESGQRYVLFLREVPQPTGPYFAVAEPGRFKLGLQAVVQSSAHRAAEYFPARDSSGFLADLRLLAQDVTR